MKIFTVLTLVSLSSISLAAPPQWALCSACHGAEGQGGIGPALAGQTAEYITDKLEAYRLGEYLGEQSPLMWPNAANLSNEEIAEISIFVESLGTQ